MHIIPVRRSDSERTQRFQRRQWQSQQNNQNLSVNQNQATVPVNLFNMDAAQAITLTNAITALTAAITALPPHPPAPPPPAAHVPIVDIFDSNLPFDLSTRSGHDAMTHISKALDEICDGTVDKFPLFLIELRLRANEGGWNAAAPTGILTHGGHDLLENYHAIPEATVEAARTSRTNDRAKQNSKAMFRCIKSSISGSIKTTIFGQSGNLIVDEDGPVLFKKVTGFTPISSTQLSISSLQNIIDYNPADDDFNIPAINTKLTNLFILATTNTRTLTDGERIQHILNVYAKILQPEIWAQWVRDKMDSFDDGAITVCQDFLNSAVVKYNKIIGKEGQFKGSVTSVHDDIVAMVTRKAQKKRKTSDDVTPPAKKTKTVGLPPFVRHYKSVTNGVETKYKVGDTKVWKDTTYYFCDCPNHRNRVKWHKFKPEDCKTRQRWLENKKKKIKTEAHEGVVGDNNADDEKTDGDSDHDDDDGEPSPSEETDPTVLLASALNLLSNNPLARDLVADAINAASDNE